MDKFYTTAWNHVCNSLYPYNLWRTDAKDQKAWQNDLKDVKNLFVSSCSTTIWVALDENDRSLNFICWNSEFSDLITKPLVAQHLTHRVFSPSNFQAVHIFSELWGLKGKSYVPDYAYIYFSIMFENCIDLYLDLAHDTLTYNHFVIKSFL